STTRRIFGRRVRTRPPTTAARVAANPGRQMGPAAVRVAAEVVEGLADGNQHGARARFIPRGWTRASTGSTTKRISGRRVKTRQPIMAGPAAVRRGPLSVRV